MQDADYQRVYQSSIENPQHFWSQQAETLDWIQAPTTALTGNLTDANVEWFRDGVLNASANCLDRHLDAQGDKAAIIWEGDDPNQTETISYRQLHQRVCQMANVLKAHGIQKGDRICLYMPMIPEAAIAMLACCRIGAIHSVVFGGFSPKAIRDRVDDASCCAVITADAGTRGDKLIPFKANVDEALNGCDSVKHVFTFRYRQNDCQWQDGRDIDMNLALKDADDHCPAEPMQAEDPLFILYTSGSTGKPKGVLHTTAGYLLYTALSHKVAFDLQPDDIYWCTADVGWITGHSYMVYGPLANGCTMLMYEGVPTYPTPARFWEVVDKHHVSIFYTAPTAIRALMAKGDQYLASSQRSSLRILGTVGEPINPEAWEWYFEQVGQKRCPIIDTWWQTETGGFMLFPPQEIDKEKPGAAMRPFFGIEPALIDADGQEIVGEGEGALVIKSPWPGMMRSVYGDHERFIQTYLSDYPGNYFSGDGARRDADGDLWITGRMDDVLNVSGHRLGTAEIESALVLHPSVAEAAVVGFPHEIKGQGIFAYVILMDGVLADGALHQTLIQFVRNEIGPIATIDTLIFTPGLPKTRSGKIMRRILRKIAQRQTEDLGDTSTLSNPECVQELIDRVNI